MFRNLDVVITTLGIAYAIYKLVELFARRRERMAMIEKISLTEGVMLPPDLTKWFSPPAPTAWALRFGLLLTGLGLGLSIAVITICNLATLPTGEPSLYFALMLFFGGLGLVVAFLIEQKNQKK